MTGDAEVVVRVELKTRETIAVPFSSRDSADAREHLHEYQVVGRHRVISARALRVGDRMRGR